jgi:hypothetical protein
MRVASGDTSAAPETGKTRTQVLPEADTLLRAGLHQSEKGVATVPA